MMWESFGKLSKIARDHLYRCSGCGKLVDDRNAVDVEVHRKHFLKRQPAGSPRQQQVVPCFPSEG
jgi:hypothetical protein